MVVIETSSFKYSDNSYQIVPTLRLISDSVPKFGGIYLNIEKVING